MPVPATTADANSNGDGRRINVRPRAGTIRGVTGAIHEVNDAGRDTGLVQTIKVLAVERIVGAVVADVADDDAIADACLRQRDDVVDAKRITMDHFVVDGGGDAGALDGGVVGFLLFGWGTGGKQARCGEEGEEAGFHFCSGL